MTEENEEKVMTKINVLSKKYNRICSNKNCKREFDNLKRKCDKCSSKVVAKVINNSSTFYGDEKVFSEINVGQDSNLKKKTDCIMGEPICVNPNSYENIEHILNEMKSICDISDKREWVFLGCDGPPYCYASRIIEQN